MTQFSRFRSRAGFTLIEVIAAMTILALVTGSIYGLLRQSIQAAADLEDSEREDQAVRRFLELCRSTLETLPADASLSLATAEETGTAQELTLSGVPEAFSLGPEPIASSDLVLGMRMRAASRSAPDAAPSYEVAFTREEFAPQAESGEFQVRVGSGDEFYQPDEQGRYWLPLLTGVRSLEWRYWNETDRIWEDDWSQAPERPTLLEMQLWPENRGAPLRAVFAIPPAVETVQADSASSAADVASDNPNKGSGPGQQRGAEGRSGDNRGRDAGGRDGGRGFGGDRGPGGRDRGQGGGRGPGGDRGPGEPGPGGRFGNENNPGRPPQPGSPGGVDPALPPPPP